MVGTLSGGHPVAQREPLFDAYVIVDWSANRTPKTGADSIWYALYVRTRHGLRRRRLVNPSTRMQARTELTALSRRLLAEGRRILLGFDFPNAYPRGFARAAGFAGKPWRAVWDGLSGLIEDGADNDNNRFDVAAALNARISGGGFPFWGCPASQARATLTTGKNGPYGDARLAERRLCEAYLPSTQPCWKLYTTGSVGGQALTGIPVKRSLRDDPVLAPHTLVWPFETGLAARLPDHCRIVLAEVYPSILAVHPKPGEVKDALQVCATAKAFARRDAEGLLAEDLAGPTELRPGQRRLIEREEGWILGAGTFVTGRPSRRRPSGRQA